MYKRIIALLKVLAAIMVFWVVGFVVSEVLAFLLIKNGLDNKIILQVYRWGSSLITIFIAFPCFAGIVKCMGMKEHYSWKISNKLTTGSHVIRISLSLLPAFILAGILLILMKLGIIHPEEVFQLDRDSIMRDITLGCIGIPLMEEYIFRGIILANLKPLGRGFAITVSTFFFVIGHNNPVNMILAIVPGIIFASTVIKTNGLLYGTIYHMIVNFVGKIVIPLLFLRVFI